MATREPFFEAMTVTLDVAGMTRHERVNEELHGSPTALLVTHGARREISVSASAVPIALNRFVVEAHDHAVIFRNTLQQPTREPEMITRGQGIRLFVRKATMTDLKFPLRRHHLGIDAEEQEI